MPFCASRSLPLAVGLLSASTAFAKVAFPTPTLPFGGLSAFSTGQWHVGFNQVSGSTLIDATDSTREINHLLPKAGELSMEVLASQTVGSKSAAAFARVTPTTLGASSSAGDPLNPDSTFTGALSSASLY